MSGSSGNATTSKRQNKKILVDCGLTGKAITAQMEKIDRSIGWMPFVTHEHSDHIKGIGILAQNTGFQSMPMKTWQAMAGKIGKVARTTGNLQWRHAHVWRL